ncbi:MAG: hypothetical protein ACO1NW_15325 [Chitinophagaceae bacterium]
MKHILLFFLLLASLLAEGQTLLTPGSSVFDKKYIKNGSYEMACFAVANGQQMEVSSFTVTISSNNKTLSVYTAMQMNNAPEVWRDTSVADIATFKPVYRSSFNPQREMVLHYGNGVKGYYYDKKLRKKTEVHEQAANAFFDGYAYPYLLGMLPLTSGYKNDLAVYEFKPENKTNIKRARIEEVKSNLYTSNLTGEHKCWEVTVFEEATNDYYHYYIDKNTRRLWKIEIRSKGQNLVLLDKETDYNPFTTTFDKEETLKMIKSGNSVITGQVFARDNQAGIKGVAVLNVNKKQYAKAGTSVVLIPYTDFYKEWYKLNEASRKKGRAIPLPKAAAECIKVTTVYDNDGHFEFTNLMPGDYMLYTEFQYVHTATHTEVVGYTDTYINGAYAGSTANTNSYNYNTNVGAAVKKIVTISKNGEKMEVKLKKTL